MSRTRRAIAGDVFVGISHSVPVIKFFWKFGSKRLSKDNITELLEEGKSELHYASEVLADPACEALISADVLRRLREDYRRLHAAGMKHSKEVDELKGLQLYTKYKVWITVGDWTRRSRQHKHKVWSTSDWARVRKALQQQDSVAGEHTTMVNDFDNDEETSPTRHFLTLTVHTEESSESLGGKPIDSLREHLARLYSTF
ncbi:hypothetical protein C2E23DRAFT_312755 [Lenzites betulinus]|nr:hypothetical protein C2E23DRAFT_312755 [Lenzites betulinus]